MEFDGAAATRVDGGDRLPGVVNYLIGHDPSRWHTGVPLFARATCRGVWPGIDVVFHGDARNVEYDFALAPGADPDAVVLRFDGADRVAVDAAGDLIVSTCGEDYRHGRPRVFEEDREIPGSFVALGDRRVGFRVEGWDPSRPLLIDPVIAYATYVGGSGTENPADVAVDATGHAFVTGTVNSLDFPRVNALPGTPGGSSVDAFVTKLNPSGASLLFSTYFGGSGADFGWAIRVDAGGVYIAGSTTSPDFPAIGAYQAALAGDALHVSTVLGGAGEDGCRALAVDPQGNAYVGGFTSSADFPTTPGAPQTTLRGFGDGWVAKIGSSGTTLAFATYFGGASSPDLVDDVAVDDDGNLFLAGVTASADLPTTGGVQPVHGGGALDGFVAKIDAQGSLSACTYLGGFSGDGCRRIAVDSMGRPHVGGFTLSIDFPVKNATQASYYGGTGTGDGFIAAFSPTLGSLTFSTFLGGTGDDDVQGMALADDDSIFVTGNTTSADFPAKDALQPAFGGTRDAFIARLTPGGSAVAWATHFGGAAVDTGTGIAVDRLGDAYVSMTAGAAGLPTLCAYQPDHAGGGQDCYVLKVTDDPSSIPAAPIRPLATAASPYLVELTWTDASRNECALRVERRVGPGEYAVVATPDTNVVSFTDADVVPDRTYTYRVFGGNSFGESAPSEEARVTTPQTLVMGQRSGSLTESNTPRKDRISVTTSLRFALASADRTFHPLEEALDIAIGAESNPFALHIPAGDPGWSQRSGRRFRWSSPKKSEPRVRVDIALAAPSITVSISRLDFPATPEGAVFLELRVGDDAGHISRAWRGLKKKPGAFKLP